MKFQFTRRNIYFYALILLALSLPLSVFVTSVAEIILVLNWLAGLKQSRIGYKFREHPGLWFILALYFLHVAGLAWSSDFHYAFHDLRIKLPILILPLVIGTSEGLRAKELRKVLLFFTAGTLASSLVSFLVFLHALPVEYYDIREISVFVSHIRLALMAGLSVFIILYYLFIREEQTRLKGRWRMAAILSVVWFIFFQMVLKSFTGVVVFLLLALILGWYFSGKMNDIAPKFMIRVLILMVPLFVAMWVTNAVSRFYTHDRVDFSRLDKFTAGGNPYFHDTLSTATENGHYVWLYVNFKELRSCWNRRSEMDYDSLDHRGQQLRFTLIRYLTSKDLPKDCTGVNALSGDDVKAIEDGVANYIFLERYSLYPRLYQIIWELDQYSKGGSPGGHSLSQRIAYLKAASHIIRNNLPAGVGTGDVQQAFDRYYNEHQPRLSHKYRRRAHNQFVTFFVTFGLVGFLVSVAALFVPVFLEQRWHDFLFVVFFLTGLLSMLNEDTLETQTGVSFFMFFYALLLFGRHRQKKESSPPGFRD